MIITDRFVMINFPKSGSSFVRAALEELNSKLWRKKTPLIRMLCKVYLKKRSLFKSIMLPNNELPNQIPYPLAQHGRWEQIPKPYKNKAIVTVVRNPYDRYISLYEFGWWASHLFAEIEEIITEFPNFPNLNFEEYIRYNDFQIQYRVPGVNLKSEIGNHTIQFIQYFFKDPAKVFLVLDDDYIASGKYKKDMPDITFLKTENLNQALYQFLVKTGFPEEHVSFVLKKERIRPQNTDRSSDQKRRLIFTKNIIKTIRWKERYLFKIYSDHGIHYEAPWA